MKKLALLVPFTLMLCSAAFASESPIITKANWKQHAEIKEIRKIVEQIEVDIRRERLVLTARHFCYAEPGWTDHEVARTNEGKILRYARVGGSDDSLVTQTSYYDSSGRLRFVYQKTGHVAVGKMEKRLYFDETGQLIWQTASERSWDYVSEPEKAGLPFNPDKDFKEAKNGEEIPKGKSEKSYCRLTK